MHRTNGIRNGNGYVLIMWQWQRYWQLCMADKRGEELLLLDGNPSVVGSERIPALEKAGNRGIIPSILYFFFFFYLSLRIPVRIPRLQHFHLSLSTIGLSRKIKAVYIWSRHRISLPLYPQSVAQSNLATSPGHASTKSAFLSCSLQISFMLLE